MPDVEFARRPGVELVKTGNWATMTGSWNPTPEDLAAAVEAQSCPAVEKPVIKLGHVDKRFDGEPAMGYFENLRVTDAGHTLVGDQVLLPWLDSVQAAAYPSRSIEGNYNHTCASGHRHKFVLTAVALLGVTPPAVKTIRRLNDLPAMLGVAAADAEVPEGAEHVQVTILAAAEVHTGAMVALIPTPDDAARLAADGGEPADELHVTLAYLGEAADLGARGRQDVIDGVSTAANGLPQFDAEAFALNVFNPGAANDRDTCIVLGLSGDPLDAVHDLVSEALRESLWSVDVPAPRRPWHAHMTLAYTDDMTRLAGLVDRVGPIRFDRIRIALGNDRIDIPLIGPDEDDTVAASAAIRDRLVPIRERLAALEAVKASTTPPPDTPAPDLPAAEPEPVTPTEEDLVSLSDDMRSRLGLADDADEAAALAAIDELKTRADKPAEPSPEMVAASAAATEQAEKAVQAQAEMQAELSRLSGELATIKASAAMSEKASLFDGAVQQGKIKPADRQSWEGRYDKAPEVITEILASIAPGTAVPVMASGSIGDPEPSGGESFDDAEYTRLFGEKAGA